MKFKYSVGLVALAAGVQTACLADEVDDVYESNVITNSLDTRKVLVRPISCVTNDFYFFAYNSDANWEKGGDPGKSLDIRLTVMDAHGDPDDPSRWTAFESAKTLHCPSGEGVYDEWTPQTRSYVKAELLDGSSVLATTYLNFHASADLSDVYVEAYSDPYVVGLDTRDLVYAYDNKEDGSKLTATRKPESYDELMPFAYRLAWFDGSDPAVTNLTEIQVMPIEVASDESFVLTNSDGTVVWNPSASKEYVAKLYGQTKESSESDVLLEVFVSLAGLPEPSTDVVLKDLPDDGLLPYDLVVSNAWLAALKLDPTESNALAVAKNGLPYWKNYVFGLDPNDVTNELSLAFTEIEPTETDTVRLSVATLSGGKELAFGNLRTDLASLRYRLISTNELSSAFLEQKDAYREEETSTFEVPKDGAARFYRARLMFYWLNPKKPE